MRANKKGIIFQCLLVIFTLAIADISFVYQSIANIDQLNLDGPSGIVLHPGRETPFIVGDEGDIGELQRDGTLVKQKRVRDADFEGITCDPSTGLLYIAVEGEERIIEIDTEDFSVLREFAINSVFRGKMILKPGGQGIEAITFVPDSRHPEGGTFYVTNQGFHLGDKEDPSAILELGVSLSSGCDGDNVATIVRCFSLGVIDLSGLRYDEMSDHLYVVSDAMNAIFEITREGRIIQSYVLPGDNQEGIAVDTRGFLYIAQDSGASSRLNGTEGDSGLRLSG